MPDNRSLSLHVEAAHEQTRVHVHGFKPVIMHHMANDPVCEFFSIYDGTAERKLSVSLLLTRADLLAMHATLGEFIAKLPPLPEKPVVAMPAPAPTPEPALT